MPVTFWRAGSASGPKGTCGSESGITEAECIAYNYGYNGAAAAESCPGEFMKR